MNRGVIVLAYFLIGMLAAYAGARLTGYDVLTGEEISSSPGTRELHGGCVDLHPSETRDYYVDPDGVCAPCNDANPGTVQRPWCTLQRALNQSESIALRGGDKLYLRGGIHRYDTFFVRPPQGSISGSASRPTVVAGYPGENAFVYGSVRINGWTTEKLADGSVVWRIKWLDYIRANKPHYINPVDIFNPASNRPVRAYTHIPQAAFIDTYSPATKEPIVLKHAQESKIFPPYPGQSVNINVDLSKPSYSDYTLMPPGYVYYEMDEKDLVDYGNIFIRPPEILKNANPNDVPIEFPLSYFGPIGPREQNHMYLANFSFRFANGFDESGFDGTITVSGKYNRLENIDASYHPLRGLGGGCHYCTIRNSTIMFNGNIGSIMVGENITYDGNLFKNNSWRSLKHEWAAGAMKLIPAHHNFTIQNNLFQDNGVGGLWLDYTGDGCAISQNGDFACSRNRNGVPITRENYIGAGHLIEGNVFVNNPLNLETSPGSEKHPIKIKNNVFIGTKNEFRTAIFVQSSPYVQITNNLFYDIDQAVLAHSTFMPTIESENRARHHQTDVLVVSNVFQNVSFPVIFAESSSYSSSATYPIVFSRNRADNNVYYGTKKPNPYFRFMKSYVEEGKSFTPKNVNHPLTNRPYVVDRTAYDRSGQIRAYNGFNLYAAINAKEYARYQSKSLDELENTIFWSDGMLYAGDYIEWAVHPMYLFTEWQARGQDTHSIIAKPYISILADGSISVDPSSPALGRGFVSFDVRRVPLPTSTLRIISPTNSIYTQPVTHLVSNIGGTSQRSCWYSIDGGITNETMVCGTTLNLNSNEGSNSWNVYTLDELFRNHESKVTFFVDSIAPIIKETNVNPPSPVEHDSTREYTFSAKVSGATIVRFVLNEKEYAVNGNGEEYFVKIRSLPIGTHTYYWEAYDAVGNLKRGDSEEYIVTNPPVVLLPGTIQMLNPRATIYNEVIREMTYQVEGNPESCWYSLDNGVVNTSVRCGEKITELSSGEGSFDWLVSARDQQGKIIISRVHFTVDTSPPQLSFVSPTPDSGSTIEQDYIVVGLEASDPLLVDMNLSVRQNGNEIGRASGSGPILNRKIFLDPGTHELFAAARDGAGNIKRVGPHTITIAKPKVTPPVAEPPAGTNPQPPASPNPPVAEPPAGTNPQPPASPNPPVAEPPIVTVPSSELSSGRVAQTYFMDEGNLKSSNSQRVYVYDKVRFDLSGRQFILQIARIDETHLVINHFGKQYALVLGRPYTLRLNEDSDISIIVEVVTLQPQQSFATIQFERPISPGGARLTTGGGFGEGEGQSGAGTLPVGPGVIGSGDGNVPIEVLPQNITKTEVNKTEFTNVTGPSTTGNSSSNQIGKLIIGILVVILLVGIVVLWYFSAHKEN